MKKFTYLVLAFSIFLSSFLPYGCFGKKESYVPVSGLDTSKKVVLNIDIVFETDSALDAVVTQFMEKYPNVTFNISYVENYGTTAINAFKENKVDIVFQRGVNYSSTTTISQTSEEIVKTTDDYYYDFSTDTEIDFSNTTQDLMKNYTGTRITDNSTYLYAVPIGGEVRGMFVNKTLLKQVNKEVPTTWTEFLDCCQALQQANYVPIQGNPGTASFALGLPACVNSVVHDAEKYEMLKNAESGVSELFRDTFEKLYYLNTMHYYDYKYIETDLKQFISVSDIGQARSFLGLEKDPMTYNFSAPTNKYGNVGFFPYLSYLGTTLDRLIDQYKMLTEYEFVPVPTSNDTNSPCYLTPYYGICGNKNSENLIWIREFVNFLLSDKINKLYAEKANIIPNTQDAVEIMAKKFNVDKDIACATCGNIFFSPSYNAYNPISAGLVKVCKANATKYMVLLERDENNEIAYHKDDEGKEYLYTDDTSIKDESKKVRIYKEYIGEEDPLNPNHAMCTLQYYLDFLEKEFAKYTKN